MKLVIDTNVLVSGAFFFGPPRDILTACTGGVLQAVISSEILTEYRNTGTRFLSTHADVDLDAVFELLLQNAVIVDAAPLIHPVCRDPDDDKFLACAIAGGAKVVVSGDRALLDTSGYAGVTVVKPRDFAERYLNKKQ